MLEVRAAPGGGLLELLLGVPLLGSFLKYEPHDAPSDPFALPSVKARPPEYVSALAQGGAQVQSIEQLLKELRAGLGAKAVREEVGDCYIDVARQRIEKVADALARPERANLFSHDFLKTLWWVDELIASLARRRGGGGGVTPMDSGGGNTPPVAEDDWYDAYHRYGQPAHFSVDAAAGVLWNDFDPDGGPNPLSVVAASGSTVHGGWYAIESSGAFSYRSAPGYLGQDWFNYTLTDGAATDEGRVTIALGNHPPTLGDDGPYWPVYMSELVVPAPGVRANDNDEDGDPFTLSVVAQPQHGSVNLDANDGSFSYTPEAGYLGNDFFTYRAFDGYEYRAEATVSISVTRPEADIDTDSDNNGTIDMTPEEDQDEMIDPGKIVRWNWDDDNGNGTPDREDGYPFLNTQGQPVNDDDLVPARLDLFGSCGDLTGFTLELGTGLNTRLFASLGRQPLPMSYTIGTDAYPEQIYVEGYNLGQSAVTWTAKNPSGVVVHSDSVKFSVVCVNIWGYRPQTEGPGYGVPFDQIHVPSWQEETPGVGIRRNGDDDNGNGLRDFNAGDIGIQEENDLIEAELWMSPCPTPGVKFYLERSNQNINVWGVRNKTDERLVSGEPENAFEVTALRSFWVEWATMDAQQTAASLELSAWDARHNNKTNVVDTVNFYPFTSVVIALGGEDQVPADPPNANHGTFAVAQFLYRDGYDVHMYDEDAVNGDLQLGAVGAGQAHDEVLRAVTFHGVTHIAILGYSHGGGSTHDLAQLLNTPNPRAIAFTSYVDAVMNSSDVDIRQETRRPPGSIYHMNHYQQGVLNPLSQYFDGGLDGGPSGGDWELDVETTA